jgi:hypothetical protein
MYLAALMPVVPRSRRKLPAASWLHDVTSPPLAASHSAAVFYPGCAEVEPRASSLVPEVTTRAVSMAPWPLRFATLVSSTALFYPQPASFEQVQASALSMLSPRQHALATSQPPAAASHSAAVSYLDCASLKWPQAPAFSAAPSAQAAAPSGSSPEHSWRDSAQPAAWPTVATGRGCARCVNLPRT